MMKRLAILGAGGHGKVVADAAHCAGWQEIIFFDERWPTLTHVGEWTVEGNDQAFFSVVSEFTGVIIAIGNNLARLKKLRSLIEINIPLATIIHPAAIVSRSAKIGPGSVVLATAVINSDSVVGTGSIINTGAIVDHDCILGAAVHISPGANLAGGVQVGELSWIGLGASIRQQITIGTQATVGVGAAVIKDIPDNCTAAGVPAEILSKKEEIML